MRHNSSKIPVAVAYGDGIGPEIMRAVVLVLQEAGVPLDLQQITVGHSLCEQGIEAGIDAHAWDVLRNTQAFLKSPTLVPQGGGYKSVSITVRKTLGLYANVRVIATPPGLDHSSRPRFDVIFVRENEEDLYAGVEHRQTPNVYQALKLISEPASSRIVRYAFEVAKRLNQPRISCFTLDNIMKMTDGLFHRLFREISRDFPGCNATHMLVDAGATALIKRPESFGVIVLPNLYGDILSDMTAQLAGSVGLFGSANMGRSTVMFEAVHGCAPAHAGKNTANPSGLLQSALMMLAHLQLNEHAERIYNAWAKTLQQGIHTADIYNEAYSRQWVGTEQFANAIVKNFSAPLEFSLPQSFKLPWQQIPAELQSAQIRSRELVGVDVFLYEATLSLDQLVSRLQAAQLPDLILDLVTSRGVKVWPECFPETALGDHWRCRFKAPAGRMPHPKILELLTRIQEQQLETIKTENLYDFDGEQGYSKALGD